MGDYLRKNRAKYFFLGIVCLVVVVIGFFALSRVLAPTVTESAIPPGGNLTASPDSRTRVIVYGDSITQGDSRAFAQQDLGNRSWVKYLSDKGVYFVGGFAQGGYTTGMLLERDQCQGGLTAGVVVAAFGTNSLLRGNSGSDGESFEQNLRNLEELKSRCAGGIPAQSFVVTGVGPSDRISPASVATWNSRLKAAAEERGWTYTDPFRGMSTAQNTWREGLSFDGLHPTEAGARAYAENIAPVIVQAGS